MEMKKNLRQIGVPNSIIRRCSIAMYEGEINMVIHADGGYCDVDIYPDRVEVLLADSGPGIEDVDKAMQEGFSTATEQIHNMGFGAGMGLPNMKRSSDELSIETKVGVGTKITMTVRMAP